MEGKWKGMLRLTLRRALDRGSFFVACALDAGWEACGGAAASGAGAGEGSIGGVPGADRASCSIACTTPSLRKYLLYTCMPSCAEQ